MQEDEMQAIVLALLGVVVVGVAVVSRLKRADQEHDPTIDELIAAKGRRTRPGMAAADHRVLDRVEQLRWQETQAAQRNSQRSVTERLAETRRRERSRRFFRVA
ncbi:MAG: hypothetical protein ABL982_21815 [Vicinamibacterales bacterium]